MPPALPTHVYLSPHLDDAALSCGGMIHKQTQAGERVVIVTVCAGDPPPGHLSEFAAELHARWLNFPASLPSPTTMVAARRAEDLAAVGRLGAEAIHFGVPDCIYRTDPLSKRHLYASEAALLGELHPAEHSLVRRTATRLADLLRGFQRHRLYAPLGLGHHVDHLLTRQMAETVGGIQAYFEDYPYAARGDPSGLAHAPETRTPLGRGLSPAVIFLDPDDVRAKVESIAAYISQISTFWPDLAEMERAVRKFAEQTGGGALAECVWRLT